MGLTVNPIDLVKALRILINISRLPTGPTLEQALQVTAGLELHAGWLDALLDGWAHDHARHTKRWGERLGPLYSCPALVKRTPVRFLEPRVLPVIDLRGDPSLPAREKRCRLCGLIPPGRATSWCPACWEALKPQTAMGWREMCQAVADRDKGICQCCGLDCWKMEIDARRADSKGRQQIAEQYGIMPGRQPYEIDHIIPLVDGGEHDASNLRLLAPNCHRRVTAEAARQRGQASRAKRAERRSQMGRAARTEPIASASTLETT